MMFPLVLFPILACQEPAPPSAPQAPSTPRYGVVTHADEASGGVTLFAPLHSGITWLINSEGRAVHSWERSDSPGNSVYLLDNGHLLRCEKFESDSALHGGGEGGRIVELDWDGNLLWEYELCTDKQRLHHDIEPLPNGNILAIIWSSRSRRDVALAGRDPEAVGEEGLWVDSLLELKPTRPEGAEIVWQWHAFDHLIQDFDAERANHGEVAAHPRRININIGTPAATKPETEDEKKERLELEKHLRAMGYAGGDGDDDPDGGRARRRADWMHTNAISYEPELDLIAISIRSFSEVWVIDHSTSTEEAAGSVGGRQGVGGDLVWRVGNPVHFHQGRASDRTLFGQHDVRWTEVGGQSALSIFNNGEGRPEAKYSSVEVLILPLDEEGVFQGLIDQHFVPAIQQTSWAMPNKEDLYSGHISGAQVLPSGGLLVCDGEGGRLIETDSKGALVWEFISPLGRKPGEGAGDGRGRGGRRGPRSGPPRRGQRPGGPPPGPRGQEPPPGDGGPRQRGGRGGPRNSNAIFRATRYPLDHPALAGRELTPRDLPMEVTPQDPGRGERSGPPSGGKVDGAG